MREGWWKHVTHMHTYIRTYINMQIHIKVSRDAKVKHYIAFSL